MDKNDIKITGDYHTHTRASDGRTSVYDNVSDALEIGLKQLAITDHSFTNIVFHMTRKKYAKQSAQIADANAVDLGVIHGVEANVLYGRKPNVYCGKLDVPDDFIPKLGVLNIGFHRLLQARLWGRPPGFLSINGWFPKYFRKKMIEKNTKVFLAAMRAYPVDTLCHLNHRALIDTAVISKAAADLHIYIELNEKHIETLEEDIDAVIESGAEFILGSDSHKKRHVGKFPRVTEFIIRHGIPLERICGVNGKEPVFKDKTAYAKTENKTNVKAQRSVDASTA